MTILIRSHTGAVDLLAGDTTGKHDFPGQRHAQRLAYSIAGWEQTACIGRSAVRRNPVDRPFNLRRPFEASGSPIPSSRIHRSPKPMRGFANRFAPSGVWVRQHDEQPTDGAGSCVTADGANPHPMRTSR